MAVKLSQYFFAKVHNDVSFLLIMPFIIIIQSHASTTSNDLILTFRPGSAASNASSAAGSGSGSNAGSRSGSNAGSRSGSEAGSPARSGGGGGGDAADSGDEAFAPSDEEMPSQGEDAAPAEDDKMSTGEREEAEDAEERMSVRSAASVGSRRSAASNRSRWVRLEWIVGCLPLRFCLLTVVPKLLSMLVLSALICSHIHRLVLYPTVVSR